MHLPSTTTGPQAEQQVLGVILPHYIARGSRESAFRMKLGADHRLCDLDQVRMVREEQHLCGPSDLSEDTEACPSAPVVEVHEEVVGEERQADPSRDRLPIGRAHV